MLDSGVFVDLLFVSTPNWRNDDEPLSGRMPASHLVRFTVNSRPPINLSEWMIARFVECQNAGILSERIVFGRQLNGVRRAGGWDVKYALDRVVSAVCHGQVLLSRSIDPSTQKSVLHGRRATALTKRLERAGFWLTVWTLGRHFRTYPEYVQDEVSRALGDASNFETGPQPPTYANGFTVTDGNLITARWPGDAEELGQRLVAALVAPRSA